MPGLGRGRCSCNPSYRAKVWSAREGKPIRKTFPSLAAAKAWRQDAQVALRQGSMKAPSAVTLREGAESWLDAAREGQVRNRSGDRYKPSVLRGYEQALRLRIFPKLGARRFSEVRRAEIQDVADSMLACGMNPSTIRNTIIPLRAIYRRAVSRGEVAINPTSGLELPAVRGKRDRIASPSEAAALIAALPLEDRAVWATATYAGLRLGELQALEWKDVDLKAGRIRVERSWDAREGKIDPKTEAGARTVPVASELRAVLLEHRLRSGRAEGLVFGRSATRPFNPTTLYSRADRAWTRAGLSRITPHECRHTYASLMIGAGVNAKALQTFMGHSDITETFNRYGHLMPGSESEAAGLLDTYLARARGGTA